MIVWNVYVEYLNCSSSDSSICTNIKCIIIYSDINQLENEQLAAAVNVVHCIPDPSNCICIYKAENVLRFHNDWSRADPQKKTAIYTYMCQTYIHVSNSHTCVIYTCMRFIHIHVSHIHLCITYIYTCQIHIIRVTDTYIMSHTQKCVKHTYMCHIHIHESHTYICVTYTYMCHIHIHVSHTHTCVKYTHLCHIYTDE